MYNIRKNRERDFLEYYKIIVDANLIEGNKGDEEGEKNSLFSW